MWKEWKMDRKKEGGEERETNDNAKYKDQIYRME